MKSARLKTKDKNTLRELFTPMIEKLAMCMETTQDIWTLMTNGTMT